MPWLSRAELRRLLTLQRTLETKVKDLEAELRSERERHLKREDELLDKVLVASGRYAMKPEPKAKEVKVTTKPPLTALEQARLQALRQAARDEGRPEREADDYFYAMREGRPYSVGQPDDPYLVPVV